MDKRMFGRKIIFIVCVFILSLSVPSAVTAAVTKERVNAQKYEANSGSTYVFKAEDKVSSYVYGKESVGWFYLEGELRNAGKYNGVDAFGTKSNVTFGYEYYNNFHYGTEDDWRLYGSDWFENKIVFEGQDVKTSSQINDGTIIVQKSDDGINWTTMTSLQDCFNLGTKGRDSLYITPSEEVRKGTYYRVIVAYTMKKRTKANPIPALDEYDRRTFAEVYRFFLCSDFDFVTINDISTRRELTLPANVNDGFYVKKNGSSATVKVKKTQGMVSYANDNEAYTSSGDYTITVTTLLNKEFVYRISVNKGITMKEVSAKIYECDEKKGYVAEGIGNAVPLCGGSAHCKLFIGHDSEREVIETRKNNINTYGVQGDAAGFYVALSNLYNGWNIVSDTWGRKAEETVNGITTGEVGTGAIIIQKSADGINWINADYAGYANGLYTTDYENHYGSDAKMLVFTPDGEDISKGTYYRVFYAYKVQKDKTVKRYLEEDIFYLCSASTEAITFKNKTNRDTLEKQYSDMDSATASICRGSETMLSGSCTTTGFLVDYSSNKAATVVFKKNGKVIGQNLKEINETGKYDIVITTAAGNSQTVTIYVDRENKEDIYKRYFGESFVQGVRVLLPSNVPVYEGGTKTMYHIEAVSDEFLPLYGTITNTTTNSVKEISGSSFSKSGYLTEAGEYTAVFHTNRTFATESKSGDDVVITIKFEVIPAGTAPGPMINRDRLREYSKTMLSDAKPIYYGLTYNVSKGRITKAFATKEAAINYAYDYEMKHNAEKNADGSIDHYKNNDYNSTAYQGAFITDKENYKDAWELPEAIYNYAETAVKKSYFDYGNEYTLNYDDIEVKKAMESGDYISLKLNHSVTIFADEEQKEALMDVGDSLPFISDKPCKYASVSDRSNSIEGYNHFEFTSDPYGADSYEVIITDVNGKRYRIEYDLSVGKQLADAGCPSCIVSIVERTKYGQECEPYKAIFIRPDENTGIIKIAFDGEKEIRSFTQEDDAQEDDKLIECNTFIISDLKDDLDPYGVIIISHEDETVFYTKEELDGTKWDLPGVYEIKYLNRLGHSFTVKIKVKENDVAVISFEGPCSEDLEEIHVMYGDAHVELKTPERIGYDFVGFADPEFEGIVYNSEIESILFRGEKKLITKWSAKKFTMSTLVDGVITDYPIYYGQLIPLPRPTLETGDEFCGWLLDGVEYQDENYRLEEERDVLFEAVIKKANINDETSVAEDMPLKRSEEANSNIEINTKRTIIVICVCVGGMLILTTVIMMSRKSRNKKK
ncbi:MAG: hypothetical protein K6F51_05075 [Acetatifactor sp.]|nr:hypothetical protein [Acetatifactor sp.]